MFIFSFSYFVVQCKSQSGRCSRMMKKFVSLSVLVLVLASILLVSCTQKVENKAVGKVEAISFKLSAPELAGKVEPSLKAGFYEELKVSKFKIIIENATTRVEKDVQVFNRTGLQYSFTVDFSGAEVLEPGIYNITIEAYPEKVGRFSRVDLPIMKKVFERYNLTAGNPHVLKDNGNEIIKLNWEKSGTVSITATFYRDFDSGGDYMLEEASLTGINGLTGTPTGNIVTFTGNNIEPGVYNVKIKAKVFSNGNEIFDTSHYGDVPVSIIVYPVVDSSVNVTFGPSNASDNSINKHLGVEVKTGTFVTLPDAVNVTTTPAVLDNYMFVTTNNGLYVYELSGGSWTTRESANLSNIEYITSPIVEKDGSDYIIYFGANTNTQGTIYKYKFTYDNGNYSLTKLASYQFPTEDGENVKLVDGTELATTENFVLYVDVRGTNTYRFKALKKADLSNAGAFQALGNDKPTSPIGIGGAGFVATDNKLWRIKFVENNIIYAQKELSSGSNSVTGDNRNLAYANGAIYIVSEDGEIGKVTNPTEDTWSFEYVGTIPNVSEVKSDPIVTASGEIFVGCKIGSEYYLWSNRKGKIFKVAEPIVSTALISNKNKLYVATNNTVNPNYNFLYEIDADDSFVYRVWRVTKPFVSSPTIYGNKLIVLAKDNTSNDILLAMDIDGNALASGWTKYRGSLNNDARR